MKPENTPLWGGNPIYHIFSGLNLGVARQLNVLGSKNPYTYRF